jgi:TolA-binding protein
LKWKVIAGACVITAIAAIVAAAYFICQADGLEKKSKKQVTELKEVSRQLNDEKIEATRQHHELSQLNNDVYESRLRNAREAEKLREQLRKNRVSEEEINRRLPNRPLLQPDQLAQ